MTEEKYQQAVTECHEHLEHAHKVVVTVDDKTHHIFPGPHVVATLKEILHVPGSDILEQVVGGKSATLGDVATFTITGGEVFISRMQEHKLEVTVDAHPHHVFPGPYIVSTFKEIVHVPEAKLLEQIVSGQPEPLEDAATIDVKGGETFVSREKANTLHVVVYYVAASKPYKDNHASRTETVGRLKTRVLTAFDLSEGQLGNQTFTYTLYHGKVPLENLAETLGQLAGQEHSLELKLNQQVTQG